MLSFDTHRSRGVRGDAPSHRDRVVVARVGRRRRAHEEVQARALTGESERERESKSVRDPAMAYAGSP